MRVAKNAGRDLRELRGLAERIEVEVCGGYPLECSGDLARSSSRPQELAGGVAELSQSLSQIIEKFMKAGKERS